MCRRLFQAQISPAAGNDLLGGETRTATFIDPGSLGGLSHNYSTAIENMLRNLLDDAIAAQQGRSASGARVAA